MNELFGIPKAYLLVALIVIFWAFVGVLVTSAVRHRVLFRMGARNLPRRRANTVLTCLGLMLAAMIFSASFATGDTLTHSIRTIAVDLLGEVDVMVMREGVEFGGGGPHMLDASRTDYFDPAEFRRVEDALDPLRNDGTVDGMTPAIVEQNVPVLSRSTSLNEPQVTLLGMDKTYMEPFDHLRDRQGRELRLGDLEAKGPGYVYINTGLAESLEVGTGDQVEVYLSRTGTPLTIAGIYESGGNPTTFKFDTNASMVMPLSEVQRMRGSDQINFILITNRGGAIEGKKHTDRVMALLEPALGGRGLKAEPLKQDILDEADENGSLFASMFMVFGSFSIIAGVLLIFLIFVMLAAERKQELGMTRAMGGQRGHIVRMFTFEGSLYALVASAIGAGLGLAFSWGMVRILDAAFEEMGVDLTYHFTTSGLIISYTLGVVFTIGVVFLSAQRVSRLNIVAAIKDLPEPRQPGGPDIKNLRQTLRDTIGFKRVRRVLPLLWIRPRPAWRLFRSILPWLLPVFGLFTMIGGLSQREMMSYTLGASLLIIGVCMLARKLGIADRAAYTSAGIGLLIFWLIPFDWHPYSDEMVGGIEMFIISGVMLVAGGVWVVMYNSDLLLAAIVSVFGRIRALTPMLKTAVSYPMASRFRTGMALAMFSLILFTLVVMSIINASYNRLLDDTERVSGGFHIRAQTAPTNPLPDMTTALREGGSVSPDDFESIGTWTVLPAGMRDADRGGEFEDLFLVGVNDAYADTVTYGFEIMTAQYPNKEAVWQALKNEPGLAVVGVGIVPTRDREMGGNGIDLVIGEGQFYVQDKVLPDDIFIEVRNPITLETRKLKVIGVLDSLSQFLAPIVTTSQKTLDDYWGSHVNPTIYRFRAKPDKTDELPELARSLEKQFAQNGMNTGILSEDVQDFNKINNLFMNLMMAFMALGLIVGIAALGVISARSVVERRHEIGVLRAIGFRQGMVQFSFLLESSFVALLGIGLGVALGTALSYELIPSWDVEGLSTVFPARQIGLIVLLAYVASLLTTFLPARQAARVYPAEALRSE